MASDALALQCGVGGMPSAVLFARRLSVSKLSINFGAMLNAIDANNLFWVIDPIEDSPVANAEFAQASKIFRHADETTMHHS